MTWCCAGWTRRAEWSRARRRMPKPCFARPCRWTPGSPVALSHLALLHMLRIAEGWAADMTETFKEAGALAQAAVDRDPADPLSLAIRAHTLVLPHEGLRAAERCWPRPCRLARVAPGPGAGAAHRGLPGRQRGSRAAWRARDPARACRPLRPHVRASALPGALPRRRHGPRRAVGSPIGDDQSSSRTQPARDHRGTGRAGPDRGDTGDRAIAAGRRSGLQRRGLRPAHAAAGRARATLLRSAAHGRLPD